MVRFARASDVDSIIKIARKFHSVSGWNNYISFDEESLRDSLENMLDSEDACVLVDGNGGVLVGMIYPQYFNKSALVAQEVFWWAEKNGMRLFKAFEGWAEDNGADVIMMAALEDKNLRMETIISMYKRNGYKHMERMMIKEIK